MENMDIPTHLAIAENKSYLYVCGISEKRLYDLILNDMKSMPLLRERVRMAAGQIWMAAPEIPNDRENMMVDVAASAPVGVYVFPSAQGIDISETHGNYFPQCVERGLLTGGLSCYISNGNAVAVFASSSDVVVNIVLHPYVPLGHIATRNIEGRKCIPFDISVERGWFLYNSESLGAQIVDRLH
jgi:hypothetical protein